ACSATRRCSPAPTRSRSSGCSWTRSWPRGSATARASRTTPRAHGGRPRRTICCVATAAPGGGTEVNATPAEFAEWAGEGVTLADVESELARLRVASTATEHAPYLRTSVMTHVAWVPEEWLEAARGTLAGMAEQHPSRTILLVPDPDSGVDRIDADV